MDEPKTADQMALDAAASIEPEKVEETTPEPIVEAELSDDDLDPDKIEAGMTAKTLQLDNTGLLKRFKKVHGSYKELKSWKAEREPKMTAYEQQAKAVDRMLAGLGKLRAQDAPDKQSFLEDLIESLMDEKGTPNWPSAKEQIEKIIASQGGQTEKPASGESPEMKAIRLQVESLKADRDNEKNERAQSELNQKVAKGFNDLPKELAKDPAFKNLPWKDAEWKKEFESRLESEILAWSSRNGDKASRGELPSFVDLAKGIVKFYMRGGSDTLKEQVKGGKPGGLTRSDGPTGQQPRQLPKDNTRESSDAYIESLVSDLE